MHEPFHASCIMHQDWGSYIHTSWVHTSWRPEGPQTRSWGPESHYRSNQIIIALCSGFHISCDMCTSLPHDRLITYQGELCTSESELCIFLIVDCHTVATLLVLIAHNHSALLKLKAHNPSLPSAIRSFRHDVEGICHHCHWCSHLSTSMIFWL